MKKETMVTEIRGWKDKRIKIKHDKLEPCPFCGSEDLYVGHSSFAAIGVYCRQCCASCGKVPYPEYWRRKTCMFTFLVLKAVKAWNKRPKGKK